MANPDHQMKTDPDLDPMTRQKIKKKNKSARYY
jgi:uncharacterized short protein YbdD (DUF466 family)